MTINPTYRPTFPVDSTLYRPVTTLRFRSRHFAIPGGTV